MDALALAALVDGSHPGLPADVRAALVREKLAALGEPDAGRVHAAHAGSGVAVAVVPPGSTRAWLLGINARTLDAARALDALGEALGRAGARTLVAAGPPGSYLRSGVRADDADELAWFAARGFVERSRHVDLVALLHPAGAPDPRVRRAAADEAAALRAWIAREFAPAWAREALRAPGALFVAGAPRHGFAAHSGNNAALGTFGPVGVARSARGAGLGAVLSRAALDDLAARGFAHATIPWVEAARVGFYRAQVASLEVQPRVLLARTLRP